MLACAIEQQDGVRALGDMAGYLIQVQLHGECVDIRQGQRRACPRAGQIAPKR